MKTEVEMVDITFLEELRKVLGYCPETGEFFWKINVGSHGRIRAGSSAGTLRKSDGRLQIMFRGKFYLAYRLAWLLSHGKWPDNVIDHIDGDVSNNRMRNLRDVMGSVNQQNQRTAHLNNKTGLLGVSWADHANKFTAHIQLNNRQKNLGLFPSAELAHAAYLAAKRELHEGCTI